LPSPLAGEAGFDPSGKRIVRRGSGKTKTEAKNKLKEVLRDYEDGLAIAPTNYTVADAVNDWLAYGLAGRDELTVENCTYLSQKHVIPALGARKLRDLSAEDVDRWPARSSEPWPGTRSSATVRRPGLGAARCWRQLGGTRTRLLVGSPVQAGVDGLKRASAEDLGLGRKWTPRELRHSFVSLLSARGVPLEEISRLVGHSGTAVTEEVYRKQIRPVIQTGAVVMDGIFKRDPER
jgi:hypothetical protein